MPKLPGVNHLDAVRALQKVGFVSARQAKHIVMTNGMRTVTIPGHNPVNAFTMGRIVVDAGLTIDGFKTCCKAARPNKLPHFVGRTILSGMITSDRIVRPTRENQARYFDAAPKR